MGIGPVRNIILIVLDTHRRDRLGMYGHPNGISPNLDSFAREATVYENAISPAQWTIPSHATMFTGEYPNTHLTIQAGHSLDPYFQTLAELLGSHGWRRVGFCNNPLVGVLDNDLKRGFERFYNYGGAIPSTPTRETRSLLKPLGQIWERYTQLLRRISYPIQNAFAQSDRMFKVSLNPMLVPMWTKFANFKGNTSRSLEDASEYVRRNLSNGQRASQFVFINLMETHLPFTPPERFVNKFVPYYREERAAREFMRIYNTQALRWLLPMDEPFSELERGVLSDFYDAEVAFQDHLLAPLLETLSTDYHRENSLVVIVSDHGEMLGEHNLMGHGFRVYQELVHVPLIIRSPGQTSGSHIPDLVSTRQLFHTILDFSKAPFVGYLGGEIESLGEQVARLSLLDINGGSILTDKAVFSEAYPPKNVLKIMQSNFPGLIELFNSRAVYRAVYDQDGYKLIRAEGEPDLLFHLSADKHEIHSVETGLYASRVKSLSMFIDRFLDYTEARRPGNWTRRTVDVNDDKLRNRLRALGYLD